MQKQGKKINGISDVDTAQMEQMRKTVIEQELSARSYKAYYEKMYYALESEKLEATYKEYVERKQKQIEEERAAFEKFKSALAEEIQKQNQADPAGNISMEGVN